MDLRSLKWQIKFTRRMYILCWVNKYETTLVLYLWEHKANSFLFVLIEMGEDHV